MSSDQLAKLQEALIEGRIDKETYDSLKADVLAAQEKPASTTPDPPAKKDDPWVRGRVTLEGVGGTVLSAKKFIEVYLDDELIGEGTANAGIHVTFETTVGSHSLTLKAASKRKDIFSSFVPRPSQVFPIQFDKPGHYAVKLKFGGMSTFFTKGQPDSLPSKIEIEKSEETK